MYACYKINMFKPNTIRIKRLYRYWGQQFENARELRTASQRIISSYDSMWFEETYAKWTRMHHKCIYKTRR